MRTANPALNDNVFSKSREFAAADAGRMTIQGTVTRSLILVALLVISASWAWQQSAIRGDGLGQGGGSALALIGGLGGFIVAMITIFKKTWAPVTAPIYALLEGLLLGSISAIMEAQYPGIAIQAVMGTFGTLLGLLAAYRSGLIQATENFRLGVVAATGGIFFIYLISFVLRLFGIGIPFIHESGLIGILFSVAVVIIAALNLVLDFDFIENGERSGAPKYMEWYAAFGLMVTLVWLYIEILRLLAKMRNR